MNCLKCRLQIDHPSSAHYGLHPDCFTEWFKAPKTAEFVSLQRRSSTSDQSTNQTPQDTSFFHGKFKKYSADLDGQSYMLKMRQDEAPELPEVALWQLKQTGNQVHKDVLTKLIKYFQSKTNSNYLR